MSNILIKGGKIVNEGRIFDASIVVEDGQIADIPEPAATPRGADNDDRGSEREVRNGTA